MNYHYWIMMQIGTATDLVTLFAECACFVALFSETFVVHGFEGVTMHWMRSKYGLRSSSHWVTMFLSRTAHHVSMMTKRKTDKRRLRSLRNMVDSC